MNSIYFCNTYMQVISAMQIKMNIFPSHRSCVVVSDHSQNANFVVERLKQENIFDSVVFCDTKYDLFEQNKLEDLIDVFRIIFGIGKKYSRHIDNFEEVYDTIVYYNMDLLAFLAYDISVRNGKKPDCIRMEESVGGYSNMLKSGREVPNRLTLARKIRKLIGKGDVFDETKKAYCFSPELFPENEQIKPYRIPAIDKKDKAIVDLMKRVFAYEPGKDFPERILFFGSSADIDGYKIDEADFVIKTAKRIGVKNVKIKTHPRDGRCVYNEAGICVMENSSIPWEVMQLTTDFSKHVFVTTGSTSIINASSMFGDDVETYMVYPLFKDKDKTYFDSMDQMIRPVLENLHVIGKCKRIRIVENEEEWEAILEILSNQMGKKGCQ